jgi:hypothetical protein
VSRYVSRCVTLRCDNHGGLLIGLDRRFIHTLINKLGVFHLVSISLLTIGGLGFALYLSRVVTKPISTLTKLAEQISLLMEDGKDQFFGAGRELLRRQEAFSSIAARIAEEAQLYKVIVLTSYVYASFSGVQPLHETKLTHCAPINRNREKQKLVASMAFLRRSSGSTLMLR